MLFRVCRPQHQGSRLVSLLKNYEFDGIQTTSRILKVNVIGWQDEYTTFMKGEATV